MAQLCNTPVERIDSILASQKQYFHTGATLDIAFRKRQLKALLEAMEEFDRELTDALWIDLHKSYEEATITETSLVKGEIKEAIKNVSRWARRERRRTPITIFGSRSYVMKEPLGCSLIVSPWNVSLR